MSRARLLVPLALLAALLAAGCDNGGPESGPYIAGVVVDAAGKPVEGARLNIIYAFEIIPAVDRGGDDPPPPPVPMTLLGLPNPFEIQGLVRFTVPFPGMVRLRVLDHEGRPVRTLVLGELVAGVHQIAWSTLDDAGVPLANGLYALDLVLSDGEREVPMTWPWVFINNVDGSMLADAALDVTDRIGRFRIPSGALPLGREIPLVGSEGLDRGEFTVRSTLRLYAFAGDGPDYSSAMAELVLPADGGGRLVQLVLE